MPKTIVIYRTKYGSTRQYAQWIAEELSCDAVPLADFDMGRLSTYDSVIFGTYYRVGKMVDIRFLIDNWKALGSKKVILFSVSGSPPDNPEIKEKYEAQVPAEIRARLSYFPLRGRIKNLDIIDTVLMVFPKAKAFFDALRSGKKEDYATLRTMSNFDGVDRASIAQIIAEAK
ncbi:Flavodoxin domain protein [uncultured archaeon]|nr:Flavodoxin domain protein [uncultured archaeon]